MTGSTGEIRSGDQDCYGDFVGYRAKFFPYAVTVNRTANPPPRDTSGGYSPDPQPVTGFTGLACDIQPATDDVRVNYYQDDKAVSHSIFLKVNPRCQAGDVLTSTGRTFIYHGDMDVSAGRGKLWRIDVEERPVPAGA
jgi:hypothetical protein